MHPTLFLRLHNHSFAYNIAVCNYIISLLPTIATIFQHFLGIDKQFSQVVQQGNTKTYMTGICEDIVRRKGVSKKEHNFLLKRNGYYCFIIQTDKEKLSILHGGSTKVIKSKSVESCYEAMPEIIELIKSPLDNYMEIQKSIANLVKAIGGEGRIHGAIVDINYYNHIFINPSNFAISGYYATSMVEKRFYRSIEELLKEQCPNMLLAYYQYLASDSSTSIIIKHDEDKLPISECDYSTDMYKQSNLIKKMQRLSRNILTVWPVRSLSSKKLKGQGRANANTTRSRKK